jgi:polyisoprenoid-binding protein YceI
MKLKAFLAASAMFALASCAPPAAQAPAAPETPPAPVAAAVKSAAGLYVLDPTHAALTWKVSHLGLSQYTARFTKFDVVLNFDPANPTATKVAVKIDPTSVETDYPNDAAFPKTHPKSKFKTWDQELGKGEGFLNGVKFPEITYTSTSAVLTGDRTADVAGDLTFLGVTKPVPLKVTFNGELNPHPFAKVDAIGFTATATLKRSDFGFTAMAPNIGDEVTVEFSGEFFNVPADAAQKPALAEKVQ